MSVMKTIAAVACAGAALLPAARAGAEGTIKVGLVAEFSGPFAGYGKQIQNGIKAYMKQHGDTVAGKKVELVLKDTTGPSPEIAKRLAQDLITHDKVDFLAGFGLTPNAMAVAPLATQAKVPMIIMNAASSIITTKSPYVARFSMTLPQVTEPIALWAAKNGVKKVFTIVSDYAPGLDAEANGEGTRPNFMAVAGYDGIAAIYEVSKKLGGKIDADKAMEVLKGLKLNSPRGPIHIDPETRDIVQTVYVRRVEKVKGALY